jgi:hypothetical protein
LVPFLSPFSSFLMLLCFGIFLPHHPLKRSHFCVEWHFRVAFRFGWAYYTSSQLPLSLGTSFFGGLTMCHLVALHFLLLFGLKLSWCFAYMTCGDGFSLKDVLNLRNGELKSFWFGALGLGKAFPPFKVLEAPLVLIPQF